MMWDFTHRLEGMVCELILEPTLIRHGYDERVLVDQFRIELSEVRRFMKGDLDTASMLELTEEMREAELLI